MTATSCNPVATPTRKRGPKTPEGKARAALNALKHGLRARRFTLLPHEDPAEFEALARATREIYRPACAVERELVEAIAVALWREIRADRLEAEVLADIPPVDGSRTCGSDLLEERHRASFALVLRYRAQAAGAVRRAQEALARHRALVAEARAEARTAEELCPVLRGEAPADRTNECSAVEAARGSVEPDEPVAAPGRPLPADPLPEAAGPPPRLALRDAVRQAANPLDTPLLRALGRDPDLVLPVPGLRPEAWPIAQHRADPSGAPVDGRGPYRRVPYLPWSEWYAHQHWLPIMERVAAASAAGYAPPNSARGAPSDERPMGISAGRSIPDAAARRRAGYDGASDGSRTHDLQGHNLAL